MGEGQTRAEGCGLEAVDNQTTALFGRWSRGDRAAGELLLRRLYPELLGVARRHLAASSLSLQPSDLLHQAWLRLLPQRQTGWQNRAHFFALVARMVRREVVDQTRHRARAKRGAGERPLPLEHVELAAPGVDYLVIDRALEALEALDPVAARVVELRHFAGLSLTETAALLEVGERTVKRRWRAARAFLLTELSGVA